MARTRNDDRPVRLGTRRAAPLAVLSLIMLVLTAPAASARIILLEGPRHFEPIELPAVDNALTSAPASLAGPELIFAAPPDSLDAFRVHRQMIHFRIGTHSLLWFQIRWRTDNGTDLVINEGYFDADDSLMLAYRIPSATEKSCRFFAYLSTDRTWQTQVWYRETDRIPIRRHVYEFDLTVAATTPTASVDDSLAVRATLNWTPDNGEIFPYLFCDLLTSSGRIAARAIGYDVQNGVRTFLFPFHVPRRVAGERLTVRCYVPDGFDPSGPLLAESLGPEISVAPRAPDSSRQRLKLAEGNWYLDRRPIFLVGANLVSNWARWDSATIVRQVASMAEHRLNYIRLWWDWSVYEPAPGTFSEAFKRSLGIMLRELERRGIFVELVPVGNWGGWNFTLYRDHWWTDSANRAAQYRYFNDVARTVLAIGVRNVAYISVMQEGSYSFDWFDPKLEVIGWRTYPGPGSIAGAEADWREWLRANGRPENWTWDSSMVEWGRWCSERFNDVMALRIKAVRDAAGDEFRFGLEGSQGGYEYDRRVIGWEPAYYLKPERWCHLVDVAEIHTYIPNDLLGYWSYERGVSSYMEVIRPFGVTANVGEYGYSWSSVGANRANNDSMPWAWQQLRLKTERLRDYGVAGCAYWCWADYDKRPFGLNDTLLRPRAILDSLSEWLGTWLPTYGRDRTALALWTDGSRRATPRAERHGIMAATSRDQYVGETHRYRPLRVPVYVTHCRGDIDQLAFDVDYDSTRLRFAGISLEGELATEPRALMEPSQTNTFTTLILPPQAGPTATSRLHFTAWLESPLAIPETASAGCLLDSVPLVYLLFDVLRGGEERPILTLQVDSASGLLVSGVALPSRLTGADSLALSPSSTARISGHGRVGVRVYERPRLVAMPDSLFTRGDWTMVLRDTVVLRSGDSVVEIGPFLLRDSVQGSLVIGLGSTSDRPWLRLGSKLEPGVPSWTEEQPRDLPFSVALDAGAARAAGDTGVTSVRVVFDAPELRIPADLRVPVRWSQEVGGIVGGGSRAGAWLTVAPNPALAGMRLEIRTAGVPVRGSLQIIDLVGRLSALDAAEPRAPMEAGVYFVRASGAEGVVRLVVY